MNRPIFISLPFNTSPIWNYPATISISGLKMAIFENLSKNREKILDRIVNGIDNVYIVDKSIMTSF